MSVYRDLLINLITASTIIIYATNIILGFARADHVFSHLGTFIV